MPNLSTNLMIHNFYAAPSQKESGLTIEESAQRYSRNLKSGWFTSRGIYEYDGPEGSQVGKTFPRFRLPGF